MMKQTIEQLEVKNVDSVNIDRLAVYDVKVCAKDGYICRVCCETSSFSH